MRTLKFNLLIFVLIYATSCFARTSKLFPATHNSVAEENRRADALGMRRYLTQEDVNKGVRNGELVEIKSNANFEVYKIPRERCYLRPDASAFLQELARNTSMVARIRVSSAIRPADVQRRLGRFNPNAAPFDGYRASSHERGSTFDIARKGLSRRQERLLRLRLLYYRAIGIALVIEEKSCYHVFVGAAGGDLDVLIPSPVGNLEQAPTLIDDATDSGAGPE